MSMLKRGGRDSVGKQERETETDRRSNESKPSLIESAKAIWKDVLSIRISSSSNDGDVNRQNEFKDGLDDNEDMFTFTSSAAYDDDMSNDDFCEMSNDEADVNGEGLDGGATAGDHGRGGGLNPFSTLIHDILARKQRNRMLREKNIEAHNPRDKRRHLKSVLYRLVPQREKFQKAPELFEVDDDNDKSKE